MFAEPKPETRLAAQLARETRKATAYAVARDAMNLCRLAKRAHKVALDRCNGVQRWDAKAGQMLASWTEQDDARAEKTVETITKQAREILKIYGATRISAQGDPRGHVLKFKLKSGASNSIGGDWGL